MIRVLVADDHDEIRRLIVRLIDAAGDMLVAAEACDGIEVLERFHDCRADVLLLDLTMPRKSGMETLSDLLERDPHARVVIVSMHPAEQLARGALDAGARGYLGKNRIGACLLDAIRTVHAGGVHLDPVVSESLRRDGQQSTAGGRVWGG